jgi:hypothetical protein
MKSPHFYVWGTHGNVYSPLSKSDLEQPIMKSNIGSPLK